jgi:hypothetical protein
MTWPASGAGHRRWVEALHVSKREVKVPACPAEGWLSDQPAPLLKRRQQLSREQALELWRQRRSEG